MTRFGDIVGSILEAEGDVNRGAVLRRFPEHADRLQELFRSLDLLDASLKAVRPEPVPASVEDRIVPASVDGAGGGPEGAELVPGFRIEAEIHSGAQGVVYRAVQASTGRRVALKVLRILDAASRLSFEREVRLAATLRHPNIVTVLDAGIHRGRPHLAMELVEGEPLLEYLRSRTLGIREKVRFWAQICAGVLHAHQKGVIHRDIKPTNVLVDESGTPRVVDFGLATDGGVIVPSSAEETTAASGWVGTKGFVPPEVISGEVREGDVRGDVYALGVLAGEMLSSKSSTAEGTAPPVAADALDRDLAAILNRATAADPKCRYQTVESLLTEIEQYLAHHALAHKRGRPLYVLEMFVRRHRLALLLLGMAALMAGGLVSLWRDRNSVKETASASAWRRFEIVRRADLAALDSYQRQVQSANRLREISGLPADRAASHLVRYQRPPLDAEGVFQPLVADMPKGLWLNVQENHARGDAEAAAWIRGAGARLDALATQLAAQSFRFELDARMPYWGLEWGREPITPAARACEAFVARSFLRFQAGDDILALSNLTAARRIAADLGDGVLMEHKVCSAGCQDLIYACLQRSLTESLRAPDRSAPFVAWMLADPDVVSFEPALLSRRMALTQILTASIVTDKAEGREGFDLRQLDGLLRGYLSGMGVVNAQTLAAAQALGSVEINAWVDRYVSGIGIGGSGGGSGSGSWEGLTSPQIQQRLDGLAAEIQRDRQQQPVLWIMDLPGDRFQARLRTQSRRQALRLTAFVMRYFAAHDRWPADLQDAVGEDNSDEWIDPRTGEPFGYRIENGTPFIVSQRTQDLGDPRRWPMEWPDGPVDVVYFPAGPRP